MTVSDLTGTTWVIDQTPTLPSMLMVSIEFTSNDVEYTELSASQFVGAIMYANATDQNRCYSAGTWTDQVYRTISITGGTDVTNSMLISWLEANATQVLPKYPNKFVIDGVTKLDLTADTVTAFSMLSGYTAHDASGATVTGTIVDGDLLGYGVSTQPIVGTARVGATVLGA